MTKEYEDTMANGAEQYADVIAALTDAGLPATFTQTGGMCAAIEIQLETGQTVLITDADDSLAWTRTTHRGWGVGLYATDDHADGPLAWDRTDQVDNDSLMVLVDRVMFRRAGTSPFL